MRNRIIEGYDPELDGKLNDTLSSMYTLTLNLSSLLGPIFGGAMYDAYKYRKTIDCNMIFEMIMVAIFLLFNCGIFVFKRDKMMQELLKKLQDMG